MIIGVPLPHNYQSMRHLILILFLAIGLTAFPDRPALVFITLGQSNADGSAFPDKDEDARLRAWYESEDNPHLAKMWYHACYVQNLETNAVGDKARIVADAPHDKKDAESGWMNLWFRNENRLGRTAMNMIHSCGTWSTGEGIWTAQGRRGMEPQLGILLQEALPGVPVYFLKLGASGSHISAWANPQDDRNWTFFKDKIFKPAMQSLKDEGLIPVICGIWWMQGCADAHRDSSYYRNSLETLVRRLNTELGSPCPPVFIGHIVKPGEQTDAPDTSVQFGQGVRDAQDAVAAEYDNVEIINTALCSHQYEKGFGGHLHIDHKGQNQIAYMLSPLVISSWKQQTSHMHLDP